MRCNVARPTSSYTPNIEEFHKIFNNSIKHVLKELFITRSLSTEKFWEPPWRCGCTEIEWMDGTLEPRWRKGAVCLASGSDNGDWLLEQGMGIICDMGPALCSVSDKDPAGSPSHLPAVYNLKLHISHPGQQNEKFKCYMLCLKQASYCLISGLIVSSLPTNSC